MIPSRESASARREREGAPIFEPRPVEPKPCACGAMIPAATVRKSPLVQRCTVCSLKRKLGPMREPGEKRK